MCVCVSGRGEEQGTGVQRDIQREKLEILRVFACVYDPTVNKSMLGATRCLLSCWVPHAGTGWLMWLPWVGDSACNQAPACNHLPLLFIYNFTEGQSCCQSCEHQCWRRGGWVWSRGREDKMGAVPQASPEVFPSDAKNDTSLAGAWGPNCQLQQIVGHCVWQKPLLLSPPC